MQGAGTCRQKSFTENAPTHAPQPGVGKPLFSGLVPPGRVSRSPRRNKDATMSAQPKGAIVLIIRIVAYSGSLRSGMFQPRVTRGARAAPEWRRRGARAGPERRQSGSREAIERRRIRANRRAASGCHSCSGRRGPYHSGGHPEGSSRRFWSSIREQHGRRPLGRSTDRSLQVAMTRVRGGGGHRSST